jgi:hypothetical protein
MPANSPPVPITIPLVFGFILSPLIHSLHNTGITRRDFRYTGFLISGRQIVRHRGRMSASYGVNVVLCGGGYKDIVALGIIRTIWGHHTSFLLGSAVFFGDQVSLQFSAAGRRYDLPILTAPIADLSHSPIFPLRGTCRLSFVSALAHMPSLPRSLPCDTLLGRYDLYTFSE